MLLAMSLILSLAVQAKLPITDQVRKMCDQKNPCILSVGSKLKPVQITFQVSKKEELLFVQKVVIKQGKNTQSFEFVEGIEGLHEGEVFPIFYDDVNKDGYQDIMVLATKGAREWLYHYLLYDSQSKKFVQQTESLPEVKKQGSRNLYTSSTGHSFSLNKESVFVAN